MGDAGRGGGGGDEPCLGALAWLLLTVARRRKSPRLDPELGSDFAGVAVRLVLEALSDGERMSGDESGEP